MAAEWIEGRDPGDERAETPEVALDLADIARRLGAADEVVSALCEGKQRWTMSIPADIERDPDIVISRALHDARRMLALLSARPAPEREPTGNARIVHKGAYTADDPGRYEVNEALLDAVARGAWDTVMLQSLVRWARARLRERAPGAERCGQSIPGSVWKCMRPKGHEQHSVVAPSELVGWTPTPENINALPEPLRRFVHDLETRCDPSGDVRTIGELRDTVAALEAEVRELRASRAGERGKALDLMAIERRLDAAFASLPERVRGSAHRTIHDALRDARLMVSALAASPDSGDVQALRPFVEFARMIHPDNDDADEIVVEEGMPVLNVGHFRALLALAEPES